MCKRLLGPDSKFDRASPLFCFLYLFLLLQRFFSFSDKKLRDSGLKFKTGSYHFLLLCLVLSSQQIKRFSVFNETGRTVISNFTVMYFLNVRTMKNNSYRGALWSRTNLTRTIKWNSQPASRRFEPTSFSFWCSWTAKPSKPL